MARILIVGGTGFIGRHVAAQLRACGHDTVTASRAGVNLAQDGELVLRDKVAGFDTVINCAGVIRDDGANSMAAVHAVGACALFRACIGAGVKRLIHISALGVAPEGDTGYQKTKSVAEDCLATLDPDGAHIDWRILRPSLVAGRGGASTGLMLATAVLPRLPRFGDSTWLFQPVHVSDLAALVARLAEGAPSPRHIDVAGPEPMTTGQLLLILREWLGLRPAKFFRVPDWLLRLAASVAERVAPGPFNPETVKLLSRGNVASPAAVTAVLGRAPQSLRQAFALTPAYEADLTAARLFFIRPILRWSLGLLWIATGVLSFGLFPIEKSYALLAEAGIHGAIADAALYGGAAIDLLLGVLLLMRWRPAFVGAAQLAIMVIFTVLAMRLPAGYWLHPFAPILKNLPIAAALLAMIALEA